MSEWHNLTKILPMHEAPCEYKIEVTCKGWFVPIDGKPHFYADPEEMPKSEFVQWKHWETDETIHSRHEKLTQKKEENELSSRD